MREKDFWKKKMSQIEKQSGKNAEKTSVMQNSTCANEILKEEKKVPDKRECASCLGVVTSEAQCWMRHES